MDKKNFAFDKTNFILVAVGVAIIILGFILMGGAGSTENTFNPEIFSTRRIVVAPVITVIGFVAMIYAIVHKPKNNEQE